MPKAYYLPREIITELDISASTLRNWARSDGQWFGEYLSTPYVEGKDNSPRRYTGSDFLKLRLINKWRNEGVPVVDIRTRLATMSSEQVAATAEDIAEESETRALVLPDEVRLTLATQHEAIEDLRANVEDLRTHLADVRSERDRLLQENQTLRAQVQDKSTESEQVVSNSAQVNITPTSPQDAPSATPADKPTTDIPAAETPVESRPGALRRLLGNWFR